MTAIKSLFFFCIPMLLMGQRPELVVPIRHVSAIDEIKFSSDGAYFLTVSRDGTARLWNKEGMQLKTYLAGEYTSSVAISPDGQSILTGGWQTGKVLLWNIEGTNKQELLGFPRGPNHTVSFSPDGQSIIAAAHQGGAKWWSVHGDSSAILDKGIWPNPVFFKDGKRVLVAADENIYIWTPRLNKLQLIIANSQQKKGQNTFTRRGASREDLRFRIGLSPNEDIISVLDIKDQKITLWGLNGKQVSTIEDAYLPTRVHFSPTDSLLLTANPYYDIFFPRFDSRTKKPYLNVVEIRDFLGERQWGFVTPSGITSAAITPNGNQIYVGSHFGAIGVFGLKGQWKDVFYGSAQKIVGTKLNNDRHLFLRLLDGSFKTWDLKNNVILDGMESDTPKSSIPESVPKKKNFEFVSSRDGSIKVRSKSDQQELATLIVVDSADWIVTTPSGLFDASPGAMRDLYFVVFYDGAFEVIELEQLKARYYEPGLLQKLIGFSEERIRPVGDFKIVKLYPQVVDTLIRNDTLFFKLKKRNGGIGKVSVFINGKEVEEQANLLPRSYLGDQYDSIVQFDLRPHQNYLLRDSTNIISLRAYNQEGWLKSTAINLAYRPQWKSPKGSGSTHESPHTSRSQRPKLYVISIGTSDYVGNKLDLTYADQDAIMMAKALHLAGTALHGDSLEVHCLSTASAAIDSMAAHPFISWHFAAKDTIEHVFKTTWERAKAEDIIVVYLSGHGVARGGKDKTEFYYLTQGVASEDEISDPTTLAAYTISSEELTHWINKVPALKQVLMIDACNSGQVVENLMGGSKALNSNQIRALERMKDRTGLFILSGSASNKVSYEASSFGQGLLTYALLEGMKGRAKDDLDIMELFQYARDKVPTLAKSINGIQTPMLGFPRRGASFPIGLLPDSVKAQIPIGAEKPVMIRSSFFNKVTFKDDLQLADKLEKVFRIHSSKGADADMIYVDVNSYPGAYSLAGLYDTSGDTINIEIRLFQGDQLLKTIPIEPTRNVDELINMILIEVEDELYFAKQGE